ncbi:SRPBCC family protein [Mycobacterium sp. HNNTM2301]|uniref:type II toxin-antitoxin system Rv0910 family toxin n=1 Tax=Mycobacterium hainanense TaxID=3289775 RepID=UPI0035A68669
MGHIEATKDLAASPDAVWATVVDPRTWDKWFTVHEKWMEEPGEQLTQGTRVAAKIVMLGMANKIEWTVETVDAPNTLALSGTGMAGAKARFVFTVTPQGAGSTFTVEGDFEGAMIKGALGKAVEKDGRKQLDESLAKLDALASAHA